MFAALNLIGLAITTVAALLMWRYPPRVTYFTENGEVKVQWTSNADPAKSKLGVRQVRLSKLALFLLFLGFFLQLSAATLAVWPTLSRLVQCVQ